MLPLTFDTANRALRKIMNMRKLILEEWVSLDGFVADREGKLDFFTNLTPEQNTYSDQDQLRFLETVDTILLGRKTMNCL
jgi:hypothetical protein